MCSLCVVKDDHHASLALIGSEFDSDNHFPRTLFFPDKSSGDLASLLPTQVARNNNQLSSLFCFS